MGGPPTHRAPEAPDTRSPPPTVGSVAAPSQAYLQVTHETVGLHTPVDMVWALMNEDETRAVAQDGRSPLGTCLLCPPLPVA